MKEAAAMEGGDLNLKLQAVAIEGGFHELCIVEGDRGDLEMKMKDASGSEGEGGDTLKRPSEEETKMKDAGGLGGDTLKRNEASRPSEEETKTKDAGGLKRNEAREEGGILKLKKEAMAAMYHWFRTRSPARMARKDTQEKAQALGAAKKKMNVIKSKYPKELIDHMAACPFTVFEDLSDERLAQHAPHFRQVYAAAKLFEAKNREYWNALIAQQKEFGCAEDEIEVTDDEEEVVKN